MIRQTLLASCLMATSLPAFAAPARLDTPMTASQFDAYSTGQTLSYSLGGQVFGTEVYKPNRKVIWAFTKEECRIGHWYDKGDEICFVYEDPNKPQCWQFYARADGMWAQYMGDATGAPMSQVSPSKAPLSCAGPNVGA
jgi:hypothetical protein